MPNLSDASFETKQILKFAGLAIATIIIVLIIVKTALIVKQLVAPAPPPKPAEAFGQLPPQAFPENATSQKLNYSVNTVSGGFPSFPQTTNVYRIDPVTPDLLAVNKIDEKARVVGFNQGYRAVSDKVFEWQSNPRLGEIQKILRANILTNDLSISSSYATDPDILAGKNLQTQKSAIGFATDMMNYMTLMTDDLDLENTKTNLYSINSGGSLSKASSLSQAQVIEVNFIQKDINKIPIFYDTPNTSSMSFFVANGQVVAANYTHHTVSKEYSSYPLKTAQEAFEDLKNGNGYIATYTGNSDNVSITDVGMAYYMSSSPQDFLMPIYVFKGTDGFYAYVLAVKDESINK